MNQKQKAAIKQFENASNNLRDQGVSVVAVVSHYTKKDARFTTILHLIPSPEAGVSEDHVALDAIREIGIEWSAATHAK